MGIMLEEGIGVEVDMKSALKWYSICAEQVCHPMNSHDSNYTQKHKDGLYNLALLHRHGKGTKQNLQKALQMFNQAHENGHAEAKLQVVELQALLNNQEQNISRIRLEP